MFDENFWLNRLPTRLPIAVAIIVILAVAFVLGSAVGNADFITVYLTCFFVGLTILIIVLGKDYWMLLPVSFTCGLPAIPVGPRLIDLPEIVTVICSIAFFVRAALKQQKIIVFRELHVPILLYAGWAAFIFWQNPIGLSSMGASAGGARFYAKIFLGMAAFIILANQTMGERECRKLITIILVGAFISQVQEIFFFFFPITGRGLMARVIDPDSYYSWHQSLAAFPSVVIMIILSRYRSRDIFSLQRLWLVMVVLLCLVMIVASGKRSAVGTIPFFAVIAAIAWREYRFLALWLGAGALAALVLISAHGTVFSLPLTAQRALSWIPAQWDSELEFIQGGKDEFREGLRKLAMEKIYQYPIIGTGYSIDLGLLAKLATAGNGGVDEQVLQNALGSSWHNTWLGFAADLGIPASVFAGVIMVTYLLLAWRVAHRASYGTAVATVGLFMMLNLSRDLAFAHIGGHSAEGPFNRWWMWGCLVSIFFTMKASEPKSRTRTTSRTLEPLRRSVFDGKRARSPVPRERAKVR